ncbi:hypothetical protein UFOVP1033_51 [uncultured Caudovirales phage]|uniref:Uncharacterized protein n=1 Tax=uncultured Caudovirales phage TaxID=2100421 RepID=A0A6J5QHF4_9CAUD|nr:hypothetical protein UFOVP1033_51 [uncultured Caudovirales phage]CAB4220668.1 hypothetical protein UFOVP1631_51 [uncultured Caudovirales phage]
MKGGDISNVSSLQVVCLTDVVIQLVEEETKGFLSRKTTFKIGNIDLQNANKLWKLANTYGVSLELAGYQDQGWTEELLDKAFDKLEKRVVNPFNYWQLYENPEELVSGIPYRANLRGVIDIPGRVARYGSAGVQIDNM